MFGGGGSVFVNFLSIIIPPMNVRSSILVNHIYQAAGINHFRQSLFARPVHRFAANPGSRSFAPYTPRLYCCLSFPGI